ncbi:sterol carrier protein [Natronomonas gomsonensis]|uniref:sterol carrier protein n=1 Tax=Natronomonas gomsonensis TaxID=1046043 RepID=UPI0015BEDB01|nr:sterol carrier protein [Natronomonas gomsonensis]
MTLYPTEQWLDEYGRLLDESDALDELAGNWGRGFNGDIMLVISELPLEETTLAELPEQALAGIPEDVREGIGDVTLADAPETFGEALRPSLPAQVQELLYQLEENVTDGTLYAYIGLEGGDCTGVEVVDSPEEHDVGFEVSAPYSTWRQIVDGRPVASALLTGDLDVTGNHVRQVRYSAMFQLLGHIAADVETTHLFEGDRSSPATALVDEAVRQPAFIQRTAERQVSRTLNLL